MQVHIGKIIHQVVKNSNYPIKKLATEIGTVRDNVYNHFEKDNLNTDLLIKYCKILNHDFFQYFRNQLLEENPNIQVEDPDGMYRNNPLHNELEECRKKLEVLEKEKNFMFEVNNLLMQKIKGE